MRTRALLWVGNTGEVLRLAIEGTDRGNAELVAARLAGDGADNIVPKKTLQSWLSSGWKIVAAVGARASPVGQADLITVELEAEIDDA